MAWHKWKFEKELTHSQKIIFSLSTFAILLIICYTIAESLDSKMRMKETWFVWVGFILSQAWFQNKFWNNAESNFQITLILPEISGLKDIWFIQKRKIIVVLGALSIAAIIGLYLEPLNNYFGQIEILINDYTNKISSVIIGDQEWATENLNVTTFRNGDEIFHAENAEDWEKSNREKIPAWCDVQIDSLKKYPKGKYYNYYALIDNRGLAPIGWHIPTRDEWSTLFNYLGGEASAAQKLISRNGWPNQLGSATQNKFNAYPLGSIMVYTNKHVFTTYFGCLFWTTSVTEFKGSMCVEAATLYNSFDEAIWAGFDNLIPIEGGSGLQIRCIKD